MRPPSRPPELSSTLGPDHRVLSAGFQRRQQEPHRAAGLCYPVVPSLPRILGREEAGTLRSSAGLAPAPLCTECWQREQLMEA